MEKEGITPDSGKNHPKRGGRKDEGKKRQDHVAKKETSWMDDLQSRVLLAVSETVRKADLETALAKHGVTVTDKTKKAGWTFALSDPAAGKYNGKKARYDKFSVDLSNKAINSMIDTNFQKAKEEQRNARELPDISEVQAGRDREYE
jgi:hypothetical protein